MARNILLLIADDLGRMTGCYGETAISTPNIDKLAHEGTRFDMAFTSTASCSASRSVIYSGLHTHENGQYGLNHDHHHFVTFGDVETAPALMNAQGYLTGIIGKIHVGPDEIYPWKICKESGSRDVRWVANEASEFLENVQHQGQPFFLTIGFVDPHRDMTRSGFGNEDFAGLETLDISPDDVIVPPFLSDLPEVRFELAEYYRSVYRLDQGIGFVLAALEKSGMAEDTMVVFLSDNGAPFLNSKTTLYDAGVHLPLIMRVPGYKSGVANPNLVSFTDILPTFLDWTGADIPAGKRKGRSLLSILECETLLDDWQSVCGSHTFHEITNYYPTRFLRTPRYKYHRNVAWQLDFPFSGDLYGSLSWQGIRNQEPVKIGERPIKNYIHRPPEELYDLQEDPREVKDLSQSATHQDLLLELREKMEIWQRETNDPWLYRDGISLRAIQHHIDEGLEVPERFDFDPDKAGNR
ncbi:MAG: sulfatase family protein [Paracoccaceae bacterium]